MIDVHCHFDMFPNPLSIVKEIEDRKIVVIGMTNLPSHFEMGHPHIGRCKYARLALGLHPLMAEEHLQERTRFARLIDRTSYVGEVGLDFSMEGIETKSIQIDSFRFVLECVQIRKKILSIHSRKAEREVLHLLSEYKIVNAIFHWYSGSLEILDDIIRAGYYFSVNPSMIANPKGKRIIEKIPVDRILTESDAPYAMHRNKATVPSDVRYVIDFLSHIHKLDVRSMENQIRKNFDVLLQRIK
ncbi:MAG: TatD family hydrolase [Flavobacteriales bacterium]|nr:TatD family hydrolase [Flavobacteriales bacterium]